jgi:hypothetical protein
MTSRSSNQWSLGPSIHLRRASDNVVFVGGILQMELDVGG